MADYTITKQLGNDTFSITVHDDNSCSVDNAPRNGPAAPFKDVLPGPNGGTLTIEGGMTGPEITAQVTYEEPPLTGVLPPITP